MTDDATRQLTEMSLVNITSKIWKIANPAMEDRIFNNDPIYMKNLIGKSVSVQTVDNCIHQGTVFVIDPVYKTVVLVDKSNKSSLEFVLFHAIKSFDVLADDIDKDFLITTPNKANTNLEDLHFRRTRLLKWLRHMFLDVKEDQHLLRVEEHVTIGPPYGKEDCMCDNTIVLERIRNIIDLMPADFE